MNMFKMNTFMGAPMHAQAIPHSPGEVRLSLKKILWNGGFGLTLLLAPFYAEPGAMLGGVLSAMFLLGLGHSVGLHRGVIHGAFKMGPVTEGVLLYLATLTGIGGPISLLHMHDTRDDYQNRLEAPAYYSYDHGLWQDGLWYLFSRHEGPTHTRHSERENSWWYRFLERTWMLQQLPWAALTFFLGGMPGLVWGTGMRVALCIYGHWFVNHQAHTTGYLRVRMPGSGEEGRNHLIWGALAMGEGWHNNHHAWPSSARFGVGAWEVDPGWWMICLLERLGLVWEVQTWQEGAPLREGAEVREIASAWEALGLWDSSLQPSKQELLAATEGLRTPEAARPW